MPCCKYTLRLMVCPGWPKEAAAAKASSICSIDIIIHLAFLVFRFPGRSGAFRTVGGRGSFVAVTSLVIGHAFVP